MARRKKPLPRAPHSTVGSCEVGQWVLVFSTNVHVSCVHHEWGVLQSSSTPGIMWGGAMSFSVQYQCSCFLCTPWMRSSSEFFDNMDHVRRGNECVVFSNNVHVSCFNHEWGVLQRSSATRIMWDRAWIGYDTVSDWGWRLGARRY